MFDIAFSELIVIGLLALIVLGPKRLQDVARSAGRWTARIRRFVEDAKRDMDLELRQDDLAELRKVQQELGETRQIIEQSVSGALPDLSGIHSPEPARTNAQPQPPAESAPTSVKSVKKKSRRASGTARKTSTPSRSKNVRTTRKRS